MTFVDTNYFLRYLIDDRSPQHLEATKFFEIGSNRKKMFVTSTLVFFEIYWVLISYYQKPKLETIEILQRLLSKLAFIRFEAKEVLAQSVERALGGIISFEDCFNLEWAKAQEIKDIASFDKKLIREWNR
jgi:predicted nucleic acid-binding protein